MSEPCLICESSQVRTKYTLSSYQIASCEACGFEFHDGFAGGGDDGGMFDEHYYRVIQRDAFAAQFEDYRKDPSAAVFGKWLGRLEEVVPAGRILDVGSALGSFLKIAEDRGWTPQGVEISRFAADFARTARGLPVHHGDLESYRAADGSFDVITFWDSIEHVMTPLQDLRTAARLLRPGGRVLLTTDNFDCLIADVARAMYWASRGRSRYAVQRVFIAPNRSYFTDATLRAILDRAGFEVEVVEKMEYPMDKIRTNWMERIILKGFYGLAALLDRQAQLTVIARKK